jgi:hypothetical protein
MEPQARPTRPGGCMIGCLIPVGAVTGLLLLWMAVVAVTNDGIPRPVKLDPTTLVGTWKGDGGSTLLLRPDGTYVATAICGMGGDGDAGGGKGTWDGSEGSAQSWSGGTAVSLGGTDPVAQELGGGTELDVTGSAADPVLWSFQGDPDGREVCRLHRAATP